MIITLYTPLSDGEPATRISLSQWMALPLLFLAMLVVVMGLAPAPWLRWSADILSSWCGG